VNPVSVAGGGPKICWLVRRSGGLPPAAAEARETLGPEVASWPRECWIGCRYTLLEAITVNTTSLTRPVNTGPACPDPGERRNETNHAVVGVSQGGEGSIERSSVRGELVLAAAVFSPSVPSGHLAARRRRGEGR